VIIVAIFAIISVYEFEISDNYFMNYLQKYFFTIDKSHAIIKREALLLLLVVITIFYVILVKVIKTILLLRELDSLSTLPFDRQVHFIDISIFIKYFTLAWVKGIS
jgi:hypothetical protein